MKTLNSIIVAEAWGFQKKVKGVWTLLRFTSANKHAVVRRFGPDTSERRVIRVAILREKDLNDLQAGEKI